VQGKMVPKCESLKNIPLGIGKLNYEENVYEEDDHVGEEALNLNLPPNLKLVKRSSITRFPICMLQSARVK